MSSVAVLFVIAPPVWAVGAPGKPFNKIDTREVFMRTIDIYSKRDQVAQRILCAAPDQLSRIQQNFSAHLGFQGVSVTAGGPDWFGAVSRGLEKLKPEIQTVIIHDGCCPAVPYPVIDELEEAVKKTGAAVLTLTPTMPLARSNERGDLLERLNLATLREIQSPQIFSRPVLEKAYAGRSGLVPPPQDDAALVRALGGKLTTIPGSRLNLRVGTEEDVRVVGELVKMLPKPRSKAPLSPFDEAQW